MTSQRTRRPTAWEVSFPGETSEGENGDEETKSEKEELAVLNGKRKTFSNVDDRVRFVPFLYPFSSMVNARLWNEILASETPQWKTPTAAPGR